MGAICKIKLIAPTPILDLFSSLWYVVVVLIHSYTTYIKNYACRNGYCLSIEKPRKFMLLHAYHQSESSHNYVH